MSFFQAMFAVMLFVSISSFVVLGEKTREELPEPESDEIYDTYDEDISPELENALQESLQDAECNKSLYQNPHAKLFTEANKTGDFEVYDLNSTTNKGRCYTLKKYGGQIKTVDTEGTCVRIFSGLNCRGWSQAIYPGSTNIPDAKLNGVWSIGPCASNEFDYADEIDHSSVPLQLIKFPSALESFANVPDLIADASTHSQAFTSVDSSSNPIKNYLLGPGNRVEALEGKVYKRHLKSAEAAENARVAGLNQTFYSSLELEEGDEPGFALPLELGGPADQIYNVFPHSKVHSVGVKCVILLVRLKLMHSHRSVHFSVNFVYKNSTTKHPSGVWYWFNEEVGNIYYGYAPNSKYMPNNFSTSEKILSFSNSENKVRGLALNLLLIITGLIICIVSILLE